MTSSSDDIRVGDRVSPKGATLVGTVLDRDPLTYICTVGWPQGQSRVHEMYLERVREATAKVTNPDARWGEQ